VAVLCITAVLIADRYRLEQLRSEFDELRFRAESRDAERARKIPQAAREARVE